MRGRIIKGIGGFYYVDTEQEIIRAKGRGVFRKKGQSLVVGDFVEVEKREDGDSVITKVYDRKNSFIRPAVSNVDRMVIVAAAKNPEINFVTVDRFLIMAEKNHADPVICISKTDLASEELLENIRETYEGVYPIVFVSSVSMEGVEQLKEMIRGCSVAFAGPSGTGKSTLINTIFTESLMETGSISEKTQRGRHTTRHVEIIKAGDIEIFDTPGFTSFNILEVTEEQLSSCYPEFKRLKGCCRFQNCRHMKEPGCSVIEAVKQGNISKKRYDSYVYNLEEIRKKKRY